MVEIRALEFFKNLYKEKGLVHMKSLSFVHSPSNTRRPVSKSYRILAITCKGSVLTYAEVGKFQYSHTLDLTSDKYVVVEISYLANTSLCRIPPVQIHLVG